MSVSKKKCVSCPRPKSTGAATRQGVFLGSLREPTVPSDFNHWLRQPTFNVKDLAKIVFTQL
jgi:hypothetical protein